MSVLTRIKNNQITDSTILANTKIVPGSIVGSLFNTNLTMTSDVTITGNLTVQGSSTYLTVASTNTYVNDPLIVLNNAFSGTNTYDIGLLFNRGNQSTASLTYNEANDEFRLGFTSDASTVYGEIVNDSYANVRLGNLITVYDASVRNLSISGNVDITSAIVVSGDLAVNGGDLTTTAATFNLVNTDATTVNFAGAATSVSLGATSGTLNLLNSNIWMPNAITVSGAEASIDLFNNALTVNTFTSGTNISVGATSGQLLINNPTVVGSTTTANLWNTTATTVNAFGSATEINIGSTTGNLVIANPNVVGSQTSQNLYNSLTTTLNFAGAATTLTVGATTGVLNLRNANIWLPNATTLDGGQTTVALFNNATALTLSATSGTTQIRNNLDVDLSLNARDIQATVIGNITPAAATFTDLTSQGTTQLGLTSATALNNTPIGNATPNTGNFTTLTGANLSATWGVNLNTTSTVTINSGTTGSIDNVNIGITTPATGNFTNLTANTANIGSLVSASINGSIIGNVTPADATFTQVTVQGNTSLGLTQAAAINGTPIGNITPSTGVFSAVTDQSLTNGRIVLAGSGGELEDNANLTFSAGILSINSIEIDGGTNTIRINDGDLYIDVDSGIIEVNGATLANIADPVNQQDAVTLSYLEQEISSGVTNIQNNNSDITITDDDINSGIITANVDGTTVFAATESSIDFWSGLAVIDYSNSNVAIDASLWINGTVTVESGNIVTSQPTFNLVNTNATTVNFAGAATTLNLGATSGTISLNNSVVSLPNVSNIAVGQTTVTVANTVATTVDAFGSATELNFAAGTGNTNIRNNLLVGSTAESTSVSTGALVTLGGMGIAKNLNVGGDTVIAGNLTVEGSTTTLNTATLDVEDLNITVAKGAVDGTAANGAGLTVDGANATLLYTHSTTSWNLNKTTRVTDTSNATDNLTGALQVLGGAGIAGSLYAKDIQATVIGNVTPAAATFTDLTSQGTTQLGLTTATALNNTPIGNATASSGAFTTLSSTDTTQLGLTTAAAINNTPIGNATPSTGSFTTLLSSGVTQVTNTSTATSVGTGAFRVDGGASVAGNLWVGGNINIVGSSFVISGNAGQFFGDVNGFGALYAGVTGFTPLPQTVLQLAADVNDYAQVNFENVNTGADASTDWVATAGAGDDLSHYINMGITSGNWDGTQENSLKDAVKPHDGYLYVQGNVAVPGSGGNLVIGAATADHYVKVVAGGNTAAYTVAVFDAPGTPSTNTTTGALTVIGGVGVFGNIHANNLSTGGAIDAGDLTLSGDLAVNGGDITTTATSFNLIDTTATTINAFSAANVINIGSTAGTTNVKNNLDVDLTLNARDINGTVIGNVTPAAATFTNLTDQSLTATRVTFAGTGGDLTDDANFTFTSNILTVKNFTINGDTAEISATGNIRLNPESSGVIDATGSLLSNVANPVSAQDVVTLSYLNTELSSNVSSISEYDTSITIVDNNVDSAFIKVVADNTEAANVTANSVSFYLDKFKVDSITSNVSVGGGSTFYVGGNTTLAGTANVLSTIASTNYSTGALQVSGGAGIAGNLSIKLGQQLTIGIENPNANVSYPERQIVAIGNINAAAGMNLRNMSSGNAASTSYIAIADNNVGESNFVSMTIAGSNTEFPGTVIKPNDAFIQATGGNLLIGAISGSKDVLIGTGFEESDIAIRISNNDENVQILESTAAVSPTTGALTVTGGVGIGANLWIANGAVINDSQTSENFTVKGTNTTSLIHADSNNGAVIIGGSNASPQLGAALKINSTDSILVPVGATADRPSNSGNVDVAGMLRFNTSTTSLEFYTGTMWVAAGSDTTFTIITNEQFTGNGLANTYVLSSNTTTSGAVVSINGILQIPTLAYSIGGNQLVFTENPAEGDLIDVRILATTQTVGDVASVNGLNSFTPDNEIGAAIYSGTSVGNRAVRATATPEGTWAYVNGTKVTYDQTPIAANVANQVSIIDSFVSTEYTSAKYLVQIKADSANLQVMEALVVTDGTDAYLNTYGVVDTNGTLGALSANVVSGNVRLYYTSSTLNSGNIKVYGTYIV
jgi:hypothetical protein